MPAVASGLGPTWRATKASAGASVARTVDIGSVSSVGIFEKRRPHRERNAERRVGHARQLRSPQQPRGMLHRIRRPSKVTPAPWSTKDAARSHDVAGLGGEVRGGDAAVGRGPRGSLTASPPRDSAASELLASCRGGGGLGKQGRVGGGF